MTETFLIIGLGNPGRVYRETRHNIGFMLVDRVSSRLKTRFLRLQSRALIASTIFQERKIILAKPQTFMNLSGQSVQGLMHFYKLPLENMLIAHDDLDLPVGTIRLRPDGRSAGQKGMKSAIERLGTDEFPRLRLGIGRPPGQMTAPDYVLQNFSTSDLEIIDETLDRAVEAALVWVTDGLEKAMTKYNRTLPSEKG
jgi:PTH1 family peptidyl-tRNA hydrolase